jgi:hypothetical protein
VALSTIVGAASSLAGTSGGGALSLEEHASALVTMRRPRLRCIEGV